MSPKRLPTAVWLTPARSATLRKLASAMPWRAISSSAAARAAAARLPWWYGRSRRGSVTSTRSFDAGHVNGNSRPVIVNVRNALSPIRAGTRRITERWGSAAANGRSDASSSQTETVQNVFAPSSASSE